MKPCNKLLSPEDLESFEKEITKLDFQLEFLKRSIIVQKHVVRARPCDRFFLEILKKFEYLYEGTNKLKTEINNKIESHKRAVAGCIVNLESTSSKTNSDKGKEGKEGKAGKSGENGKTSSVTGGIRAARCK